MSTIYLTVIYWSSLCTNMHQLCHKSPKKVSLGSPGGTCVAREANSLSWRDVCPSEDRSGFFRGRSQNSLEKSGHLMTPRYFAGNKH